MNNYIDLFLRVENMYKNNIFLDKRVLSAIMEPSLAFAEPFMVL